MLHEQKEVEDDRQRNDNRVTANAPNFIAIEGPIGVGKTTLAKRLAETFGKQVLLEPSFENPFLESFYANGSKFALPTQLYFLLNRARQLAEIPQPGIIERHLVSDFLFEKDRLFAELTLNKEELKLYDEITTAGKDLNIKPFGARALMSMRLEKNWGAWTLDYRPDFTAKETGLDILKDIKSESSIIEHNNKV